jgi:hypothetical protein
VRDDGTVDTAATPAGDDLDDLDGLRAAAGLAWADRLPPTLYDVVLDRLGLE